MDGNKKFFIIFDCDHTITNVHSMFFPAEKIFGIKEKEECVKLDKILWSKGHEYFLNLLREKKISDEKLNEVIDKIPLCPGIENVFKLIKNNKEICKCIILTSNLQLLSEGIMKHMGYYEVIDAFVGSRRIETKIYEKPRIYPNGIHDECNACSPNPCKVNSLKEYLQYNNITSDDDIKIFVCDGGNDLCFAKTLIEKDYVLARKGYGFIKKVMKEKRKNEIKAKLLLWENGEILSQIIYSIFERVNSIKPKVFVLGAVNIDYKMCPKKIPLAGDLEISETFSIDAGGKANNQACALAKLGLHTYLISCIGKFDPRNSEGDLIDVKRLSKWKEIGLNTQFVKELEGQTGVTLITNGKDGKSTCEFMGLNTKISRSQIDEALRFAKPGDYFLTTYEPGQEITNYALTRAKDKGMTTFLSPAPAPEKIENINLVDYLVAYKQEIEQISGMKFKEKIPSNNEIRESFKNIKASNNLTLIIYLGPNEGSIFKTGKLVAHIEPPETEIIDNTSCRGAFIGGFIYKRTSGEDLQNSMDYGNFAAAYTSSKIGAIKTLPNIKELEKFKEDYESKH